ncbi:MAG: putative glycoside hydrolase [Ruminococcus sp.]|nr:putative glycoside hydrolase [Ruminococcus sp.]
MKIKNKGRKIYKTKEKNYYGKSPAGKFFSALLTILLIGGIGFLGYSVAGPMINYSRKQGDEDVPETTSQEETAPQTTAENQESTIPEVKESEVQAYRSVRLNEYEIMNTEAIKTAIGRIPQEQDIEYIEVPLKLPDGRLTYSTGYEDLPEISDSDLKLSEITRTIRKEGYTPVAYISTFADNTIPEIYPQYSYLNPETVAVWSDANSKTWGSPFSENYVKYLEFIVDEISGAGFKKVICSDIKFPVFSDRDLTLLNDSRLESPERYTALTDTENILYNAVTANDSDMFIEVSASDLLSNRTEILDPFFLKSDTIVLDIDLDEISKGVDTGSTVYEFISTPTENITKMLELTKEKLSDFNIVVCISGTAYNTAELLRAKDDIAKLGYISFILG